MRLVNPEALYIIMMQCDVSILCLRWTLREHCTEEAANGHDYHHYSFSRSSGCELIATALLLVISASLLLYLRCLQCI